MQVKTYQELYFKGAEIAIIYDVLYNVLMFDDGALTILIQSEIHKNLLEISGYIHSNHDKFEPCKQLRMKVYL